jgi:hypothetical protein
MGYSVALTIGNAKTIDLTASNTACVAVNFQVKATLSGHDWLVRGPFADRPNLLIALVRLGTHLQKRPELYLVTAKEANQVLTAPYASHSPRIKRSEISALRSDHDLSLVIERLGA